MRKAIRSEPSRPARVAAAALAFLLTGGVWLTVLSALAWQTVHDVPLHERIALSEASLSAQEEYLDRELGDLARRYGLRKEALTDRMTREELTELNRQVIRWWTGMAQSGVAEDPPMVWASDLWDILPEEAGFGEGLDEDETDAEIRSLIEQSSRILTRSALSLRGDLLATALRKVSERINLSFWAGLLGRLPLLLLLMSALLAGMIALVMSRRISMGFRRIAYALGADALLLILTGIALKCLNIGGMIRQSSERFAAQYTALENTLLAEAGGAAVLFLLLWAAGALIHRKAGDAGPEENGGRRTDEA